jgi:4-alpha-glucanotransferase
MRQSGILLSVTSLPSPYGIGTLGLAAYSFVDFLAAAGQSIWQILPLGVTGAGNSPYHSLSAFAGNPLLIDLEELVKIGLLRREEIEDLPWGDDPEQVDYEAVTQGREIVLTLAFQRFSPTEEYRDFCRREDFWLTDYALFQALKKRFGGVSWLDWPEDIRSRQSLSLEHWKTALCQTMDYHRFVQFLFFSQWERLHSYAREKGVSLWGDVPIYVPLDSVDVWANPHLFQLEGDGRPAWVAGVPPDYFSPDGQLWGNPLYDWQAMERDDYAWWVSRLQHTGAMVDGVRIDHFRGLESYWAVPAGEITAQNGQWRPGGGQRFIQRIQSACGSMHFVAEDLGFLTEEVHALRRQAGWPGMKILQFAFDGGADNLYLPHSYEENSVCYTGTHDNETLAQWWDNLPEHPRDFATAYLGLNDQEGRTAGLLRGGMASVAQWFISPMQDWLGLGEAGRMNTPGQSQGCWRWRLKPGSLTPELASSLRAMTARYGRLPSL